MLNLDRDTTITVEDTERQKQLRDSRCTGVADSLSAYLRWCEDLGAFRQGCLDPPRPYDEVFSLWPKDENASA